jgi:hypothetical protein
LRDLERAVTDPGEPSEDDSETIPANPKVYLIRSLANAICAAVAGGDLATARAVCRAIAQVLDQTPEGTDVPAPVVLLSQRQPNRR